MNKADAPKWCFRYELLEKMCIKYGVLHLFVGHHALDQAETILMRGWQGSKIIGLSGMSMIRENSKYRMIRPLLNFHPDKLKEYLISKN